MDIRLGGLIQRMYSTQQLLRDYLDGKLNRLETFEEPVMYADFAHLLFCR